MAKFTTTEENGKKYLLIDGLSGKCRLRDGKGIMFNW